jgi:hypothetical protein
MFSSSNRRNTKFHYIPRYFDQGNQNLIYKTLGNGQFAQNYIKKKYSASDKKITDQTRIDFSSYRNKPKLAGKKSLFNIGMFIFVLSLILFSAWILTEGNLAAVFPTND